MKTTPGLIGQLLFLCLLTGLVFIGCKKETSNNLSPQQEQLYINTTSQSDATATAVFDDVFDNVVGVNNDVGVGSAGIFANALQSAGYNSGTTTESVTTPTLTRCFTVTITHPDSPATFPVHIVIDFGDYCTGADGRTRKGKIITDYTNRLVLPGSKATTSFEGFMINDLSISGTHIIENVGSQGNRSFRVQINGAKLTGSNGNYIEWNRDITVSQIDGASTPLIPGDDVYSITGQANGAVQIDSGYFQWSNQVTDPLIKKFNCHWIVQGGVSIKRGNKAEALLDYGTGDCDNIVTVTSNGNSKEFTLH